MPDPSGLEDVDPFALPAEQYAVMTHYGVGMMDGIEIRTHVREGTFTVAQAAQQYGYSATAVKATLLSTHWREMNATEFFDADIDLVRFPVVWCPDCDREVFYDGYVPAPDVQCDACARTDLDVMTYDVEVDDA